MRKRFGQHFLEPAWVEKLIGAIAPRTDQDFIEIGPGQGALTRPLAARARSLVAVEIDRSLAAGLRRMRLPNLKVVEGDFLRVSPEHLRHELAGTAGPVRAVGNLPYYAASPILFRLIALQPHDVRLAEAIVMLQREVADPADGGSRYPRLRSIDAPCRHSAEVELLFQLPPGAFRPVPKVHSALVRLRFHPPGPAGKEFPNFRGPGSGGLQPEAEDPRQCDQGLRRQPRSVPLPELLAKAGLDRRRRPETLALAEWIRLADIFCRRICRRSPAV